ncbi:hypothetical protein D3C72_1082540 [compost metagenome]
MVGQEENDGVLLHPRRFQDVENLADLLVDIGDIGEITAPCTAYLLRRNIESLMIAGFQQPFRMRILLLEGNRRCLRIKRRAILVEIPEFAPRHIGVVRMGEADGQAPGAVIKPARQIVELAGGVIGHLIVIFHLVGDFGDTRTGDGAEIVIPPVDALAGLGIIRRPTEIRRIDIRRQTLFEAMQLVGPDEMHLA